MLACGHDSGYAGALRPYTIKPADFDRISLLATDKIRPEISSLGFKSTTMFKSLFRHTKQESQNLPSPPAGLWSVKLAAVVTQQAVDGLGDSSVSSRKDSVVSCARLGPVLYGADGRRVDRPLKVDEKFLNVIRKNDFCHCHFLRAGCVKNGCGRKHDYPVRPLSDKEFDAMWHLSRGGKCHRMKKKNRNCTDDRCVFGH